MPGVVLSHGVQRSTDTVSGQKESPVPKDHGQTKPKTTTYNLIIHLQLKAQFKGIVMNWAFLQQMAYIEEWVKIES